MRNVTYLSLALLSAFADPSTNPAPAEQSSSYSLIAFPKQEGFVAAISARTGVASYTVRALNTDSSADNNETYNQSLAAQLAFDQIFGVGDWFYVQLREYAGLGIANDSTISNDSGFLAARRVQKALFLDADATLYIPFVISRAHRITLQPAAGFSVNQAYFKGYKNPSEVSNTMVSASLYQQIAYSPLVGVALGYMPTNQFSLRCQAAFLFPNISRQINADNLPYSRRRLRSRRLGMRAGIEMRMALSGMAALTGEANVYALDGFRTSVNNFGTGYMSKSDALVGISCRF